MKTVLLRGDIPLRPALLKCNQHVPRRLKVARLGLDHNIAHSRIELGFFWARPVDVDLRRVALDVGQCSCCNHCYLTRRLKVVFVWAEGHDGALLKSLRLRPADSLSSTLRGELELGGGASLGEGITTNVNLQIAIRLSR